MPLGFILVSELDLGFAMTVAAVSDVMEPSAGGAWAGVDAANAFLSTRRLGPSRRQRLGPSFRPVSFAGSSMTGASISPPWCRRTSSNRSTGERSPTWPGQDGCDHRWARVGPGVGEPPSRSGPGAFEYQVLAGVRAVNPVPAHAVVRPRPKARGMLGHLGPGRPRQVGASSAKTTTARVLGTRRRVAILADMVTHRVRAIVLLMVFGGFRAPEVRSLRLADVDQGRRQVRVFGKGGRERTVPVDRTFFTELAAYLRVERPPGLQTPECFVVLHGPTTGGATTEAGMRSVFRYHRPPWGRLGADLTACATPMARNWREPGRPVGAARPDGPRQSRDHRRLRAPFQRARRRRVRRSPGGDGAMTASVARWAVDDDHGLMEDYAFFCHDLGVTDRALRDRLRLARTFLAQHPDLNVWMVRPTRTRLADLERIRAWSLVSWAALTGRVQIDLDLLAAKDLGGMSATIRQLWPVELNGCGTWPGVSDGATTGPGA